MNLNKERRALARFQIDSRTLRRVDTTEAFNAFIDERCEDLQGMKLSPAPKPKKSKPKQEELGIDRESTAGQVRGDGES